jgi:hypothetical protein
MRNCIAAVALCAGCLLFARKSAAQVYEPFDYAPGQRLTGQTNTYVEPDQTWTYVGTAGTTVDPVIGTGSLSYPGLPAPIGNSVLTNNDLAGSARLLLPTPVLADPATSVTVYYSALVRVTDISGLTNQTTGAFFTGLSNSAAAANVAPAAAILLIHRNPLEDPASAPASYNLGVAATPDNGDRIFGTTAYTTVDTLFVVGAYTMNPGADNDLAQLWINPAGSTFGAAAPPPPTVVSPAVAGGTADLANITNFFVRNNGVEPQQIQVDEFRVDTTWAGVTVPEPSTLGVLGLCGASCLARRRRR